MSAGALAGRVAIVTGGGRNIGRAVAEAFAAAGARVVVASRSSDALAETVRRIEAAGGAALAVPTDASDVRQVDALVARVLDELGAIDVLAAIAGGGSPAVPIDALEPDDWERVFRQNVTTTFLCARAVLPHFRARDAGVILTCAGGGAFHPVLGASLLPYACAKAAICRFTDQLTAELWETGIRVNCIEPGHGPASAAAELALWLASDASRPLRGRCVAAHDDFWRDPDRVRAVDATVHAYRLRRAEP